MKLNSVGFVWVVILSCCVLFWAGVIEGLASLF